MNLRHAAALALVGWYLMVPSSGLTAGAKAKLSNYTNQIYGFSFRYPSDWTLTEGDEVKLSWGYLGQVGGSLKGGVTVAAVQVPSDPYLGTNFGVAFLKVMVDASLTPDECNRSSFAHVGYGSTPAKYPTTKLGGNLFTNAGDGDLGLGHSADSDYYHIFRNGVCYEFQIGLGLNGGGPAYGTKYFDDATVLPRLKAIIASVKFRPPTLPPQALQPKVE